MTTTFPSSVDALATVDVAPRKRYPWNETEVGYSFAIAKADFKKRSLQTYVLSVGKRLNKTFRIIDHPGDHYEVARVK